MSTFYLDLVTLAEVKAHLRYGDEADSTDLASKIEQASNIVLDYLKLSSIPDAWTESGTGSPTEVIIPPLVKSATLMVVGALDKDRIGEMDPLSPAVCNILRRFRDPALA